MKKKYIFILATLFVLGLIIAKLIANKKAINQKNQPAKSVNVNFPVKVFAAEEQPLEIDIKKTGELAPIEEAKAIALTSGAVQAVRFSLGEHVSAGQVLALTDTRIASLDLDKAQRSAAKLAKDLDTYTQLLAGKATTEEKVNDLKQNYEDAENQVGRAKKALKDAEIKSPINGIVSAKNIEQGVVVSNGTEVATIVDLSKVKVQVHLTESEIYKIQEGQLVNVTTEVYPGTIFKGTVTFISPKSDQTHNYLAEVQVANTGRAALKAGTFVYADFSRTTKQRVLVIPRESITDNSKNASVFVVENGVAHLRNIETGIEVKNQIQVVSGLRAGEKVVISGQITLVDGSPVNIIQ